MKQSLTPTLADALASQGKFPQTSGFAARAIRLISIPKNAVNITYNSDSPAARMLSNLAPTPFVLDGKRYESVEAFWQGLKFESEAQRAIIAKLSGLGAKKIGEIADAFIRFRYNGENYAVGSPRHHDLLRRAIREKLLQNPSVLELLLSTKDAPLLHMPMKKNGAPYPDSVHIPGTVFAQILMDLRAELALKK